MHESGSEDVAPGADEGAASTDGTRKALKRADMPPGCAGASAISLRSSRNADLSASRTCARRRDSASLISTEDCVGARRAT